MEELVYLSAFIITIARFLLFFTGGFLEKGRNPKRRFESRPFATVIVPSRNEEDNIEECLRALSLNSYPENKYEIIAVNDRSTDNTLAILKKLKNEIPNLKIIDIQNESDKNNLQGKAGALQKAVDIAKGEIILVTDADCQVPGEWIETHIEKFADDRVGMCASFTQVTGNKIFSIFQSLEWLYLSSLGSGGIGMNLPLSCFGNNTSFRKKFFDDLGGYRSISFSVTEDLALLHAMYKAGHRIRYFSDAGSLVRTNPVETFKAYLNQHHRWAIGAKSLGFKAFAWVVTSFAFWAAIVTSIIFLNWPAALFFIGLKIFLDIVLIIPDMARIKLLKMIPWMIPSVFFFLFMELITPFQILKTDISWKGQKMRNS